MDRTPARTVFLIVAVSIVVATTFFWFLGNDGILEKFLFTVDTSEIIEERNFFGRLEGLSFVLSGYPYSLKGFIELYREIAEANGWRIDRGGDFNFNELGHEIEASKDGQKLTIKIKRFEEDFGKLLITLHRER